MDIILISIFITVGIGITFCLMGYILYKLGYARSVEEGSGLLGSIIASAILDVLRFLPKIFRPLFRFLYEAVYEGWTGHDLPEKLIHAERILSNAEVLELVQKFKNNPYIVPSLGDYIPNYQGILWLDIKAVELALRYQSFIREDICNMADYIIQNFYMETRGYIPNYQGILWLDIKAVELALRYQSFIREDICNMADYIIQNFYMETRGIRVKVFIKVASPKRLYFAIPLSVEGEKYLEKQAQEQPQIQDSYEDVTFDLFEEEIPEDEGNDNSRL